MPIFRGVPDERAFADQHERRAVESGARLRQTSNVSIAWPIGDEGAPHHPRGEGDHLLLIAFDALKASPASFPTWLAGPHIRAVGPG
jgi:hypothetical protein